MTLEEALRQIVREELAKLSHDLELIATAARQPRALGRLLTAEQVAEQVQVDVKTVQRWVRAGKLRAKHAGRELRIKPEDLEDFLSRPRSESVDETDDEIAERLARGG